MLMKEIESLLLSGKKPKEIIKMGYAKSTVYEVYKRLRSQGDLEALTVFRLLEEGKSLTKIVIETGISPENVKQYYEKWYELKRIDINQPTTLELLSQVQEILERMIFTATLFRDRCRYFNEKKGICEAWRFHTISKGKNEFKFDKTANVYRLNVGAHPEYCIPCKKYTRRPLARGSGGLMYRALKRKVK